MGGQRRAAAGAAAGDHVEHPVRNARLGRQLRHPQQGQRGGFRGLMTIEQPAARAGMTFHMPIISGKFHGTMPATTPTGSFWSTPGNAPLAGTGSKRPASGR